MLRLADSKPSSGIALSGFVLGELMPEAYAGQQNLHTLLVYKMVAAAPGQVSGCGAWPVCCSERPQW